MTTDNVIYFPGEHVFIEEDSNREMKIDVSNVLDGALNADLQNVMVLGRDKDDVFYLATSSNNLGFILVLLKTAEKKISELLG